MAAQRDQIRDTLQDRLVGRYKRLRRIVEQTRRSPGEEAPEPLITVIFDNEQEYLRFTDYVYDAFRGAGLEFTNVPCPTTVRVAPWLLQKAEQENFGFRRVSDGDLARVEQSLRERQPFDEAAARAVQVPASPRPTTQRTQQ